MLFTGDIFVSYSRTDIAAARTLYEELKELGAGIVWFDKDQIEGGDKYRQKITEAISRCKLFLPLLSASTESRAEGFFRKEWGAAEERDKGIQGRKFIIPVVVDKEWNGDLSHYKLFPDRFSDCNFLHAPEGHLSDQLRSTLINELRDLRRGGVS